MSHKVSGVCITSGVSKRVISLQERLPVQPLKALRFVARVRLFVVCRFVLALKLRSASLWEQQKIWQFHCGLGGNTFIQLVIMLRV